EGTKFCGEDERLAQRGGAHHERLRRQLRGRRSREAVGGHAHHRIFREGHRDRGLRLDEMAAHLGHLGVAEHGRRHRSARAWRQHHHPHPDAVALGGGETGRGRNHGVLTLRALGDHGIDFGRGGTGIARWTGGTRRNWGGGGGDGGGWGRRGGGGGGGQRP